MPTGLTTATVRQGRASCKCVLRGAAQMLVKAHSQRHIDFHLVFVQTSISLGSALAGVSTLFFSQKSHCVTPFRVSVPTSQLRRRLAGLVCPTLPKSRPNTVLVIIGLTNKVHVHSILPHVNFMLNISSPLFHFVFGHGHVDVDSLLKYGGLEAFPSSINFLPDCRRNLSLIFFFATSPSSL